MRKRLLIIAIIAAIPLLLSAGVLAFPMAGALACPMCYGLDPLGADTFVEHGMTPAERAHVADVLAEARNRVRAFYGELEATPRILVCSTEPCDRHLGGGGARGSSPGDIGLRLSPRGIDPVIASHELSHIELHHRLGLVRFLGSAVPAWFDEGLAVVVSDDPRYLAPIGNPDRCLVKSDESLPSAMREWTGGVSKDSQLYAKAACRVATWLLTSGSPSAVTRLVKRLSNGARFQDAYAGYTQ